MFRTLLAIVGLVSLLSTPAQAGAIEGITYLVQGSTSTPEQSHVTLTGPVNREMDTTPGGFFRFTDLPAGNYSLTAVPLDSQYSGYTGDCDTPLGVGPGTAVCDIYMTSN